MIFFAGQGLAALAFAIVALVHIDSDDGESTATWTDDLHDLGKLLLAFTMFWAYVSFSQFLIIWYGNLPEEVVWYQRRLEHGWQWVGIAIAVFHFIIPFVILLGREIKRKARPLAAVALWMLAMRWLDTVWQIEPAFAPARRLVRAMARFGDYGCHWRRVAALLQLAFGTRTRAGTSSGTSRTRRLCPVSDSRRSRRRSDRAAPADVAAGHEVSDVSIRGLVMFLVGLVVSLVVVGFAVAWMLELLADQAERE